MAELLNSIMSNSAQSNSRESLDPFQIPGSLPPRPTEDDLHGLKLGSDSRASASRTIITGKYSNFDLTNLTRDRQFEFELKEVIFSSERLRSCISRKLNVLSDCTVLTCDGLAHPAFGELVDRAIRFPKELRYQLVSAVFRALNDAPSSEAKSGIISPSLQKVHTSSFNIGWMSFYIKLQFIYMINSM